MKAAVAVLAVLVVLAATASASARRAPGDPPRFGTVLHTLQTDVTKIASDLRQEELDLRRPAGAGGASACYNLFNNVDYEAVKAIAGFVSNTVSSDQSDMQADLNQLRSDITSFNNDIAAFTNDGVARPAGAAASVAQISRTIQTTKSTANGDIGKINAAVRRAYGMADTLAVTAGCPADDRPENQLAMPAIASVS